MRTALPTEGNPIAARIANKCFNRLIRVSKVPDPNFTYELIGLSDIPPNPAPNLTIKDCRFAVDTITHYELVVISYPGERGMSDFSMIIYVGEKGKELGLSREEIEYVEGLLQH